jgi:hypothetical protein
VTRPLAVALRQDAAPADLTMLKTVLSPAAALASGAIPIEAMATANVKLAESNFFFMVVLLKSVCG